ncbi:MAG: AAA family ATPase [Desulfobacterota bacterium]|nr:AAA family ATPase [Thermodesulfobacteriota bacterium]MDW8002464.1 AAA family ATPase [Deltaproteobacteria bacterium]
MAQINVVTGRGGAGKSTFTALFARFVKVERLLLIDLDPDSSLPKMVGADLERNGKVTVSEALYDIMVKDRKDDAPKLIEERLKDGSIIYKAEKFHLVTLGTKLAPGCYCLPDEMIKDMIQKLRKDYDMVLVDSPAGLEHLNRKVTPDIDDLFVILDPSEKSLKHIERIKRVIRGVRINYKNFYLVANYRFTDETIGSLKGSGEALLGRIYFDENVRTFNLEGKSLFLLPEDSPASRSVKQILLEARYDTL